MLIHDVKFDTKDDLRNPSQKTSMSSKYDCVLDALSIMLGSWKLTFNSIKTCGAHLWCKNWYQKWPDSPNLQSGTINILRVWWRSWCNYNHARELKISIKLKWHIILIHDIKFDTKDDPILQNSSKEPSMSSKHDCLLGTLIFMIDSWKLVYI